MWRQRVESRQLFVISVGLDSAHILMSTLSCGPPKNIDTSLKTTICIYAVVINGFGGFSACN